MPIYTYVHFYIKVPLFLKFESSPGSLLLNTVTQILVLWKILIQYKILDGKHTLFSVFCPQSSTFKKTKKCMFFISFIVASEARDLLSDAIHFQCISNHTQRWYITITWCYMYYWQYIYFAILQNPAMRGCLYLTHIHS